MFDKLRGFLKGKAIITEAEFAFMKPFFIEQKIKKGEFLQQAGTVTKYGAFIVSGCLRSYVIDAKGKEHIIQFAPENWWLSDLKSLTAKTPSLYFMDAIEDSELLLIDQPSFQKILDHIPGFASAFQAGIQKNAITKDQRIVASLSASAEERYLDFLKAYPSIALRVPQHMLASYLGITPETLSRVRKSILKK